MLSGTVVHAEEGSDAQSSAGRAPVFRALSRRWFASHEYRSFMRCPHSISLALFSRVRLQTAPWSVCALICGVRTDRCPCTHSTLGPARIGILYDMRHGLIVMSCKCNYTLPPTAPSKRVRPSGDRGRLRTASGRLLDGVGWWASALCGGAASRPGGSHRCGRTMQRSAGCAPPSESCDVGLPLSQGRAASHYPRWTQDGVCACVLANRQCCAVAKRRLWTPSQIHHLNPSENNMHFSA